MKKIEAWALFVGAISGVLAYFLGTSGPSPFSGVVFGIFCIPFFWYYFRSVWKVCWWVYVSGFSFVLAAWSSIFVFALFSVSDDYRDAHPFESMIDPVGLAMAGLAVGGAVGATILLIGFRFLSGTVATQYILIIIFSGMALPILLVLISELGSDVIGPALTDEFLRFILMVLWQASMLYWFVRLLRIHSEQKTNV
ncbi:MAG: hypothetical protein ACI9VM_001009 [Candidatus Azotimanducaceae bacterium]|jgi:hypothetical protein